jgi:hypothetical protein
MLAMNKPAADATKSAETTATVPAAEVKPNPTPPVDSDANEVENPFAVFSDTASTARSKGSMQPPAVGTSEAPTEGAPADTNSPAEGERPEGALGYLNAAGSSDRGRSTGLYRSPQSAATAFLAALKEKNLAKIAEATALRAPIEAVTKNQKLFVAILEQNLAPEDLDELAKKLEGYQYAGENQAKSSAKLGIILTKNEGTSVMSRTLTMRHEKAGWKILDISGEREFEKPISMPRPGGRRR